MKYKIYFEEILINLNEAKFNIIFNNDSEQFEYGARAARYRADEIA